MASQSIFKVPSGAVAEVHIIDSKVRIEGMPASMLLTPGVEHFDILPPLPSWSFLVQSSKGEKILFDLSTPADLTSFTPTVQNIWTYPGIKMNPAKDIAEILKENQIDPAEISSVIWRYVGFLFGAMCNDIDNDCSHHHSDHIGDIRTFPKTTELVVGPGFKKAFYPGYPINPDSELHESYFEYVFYLSSRFLSTSFINAC
jgi:hypothetical protein